MQAPPVDKRSYHDIVAETEKLAQEFSGWQPRPDGQPDAGQALIRIFGRFAELVVERINRAPEKNELAFLNLIGTQPLPPLPARVPLTFSLAARSPVDAVVPAGTQVTATPLEAEEDEVIFETERSLVVTRAQLQAVYVSDTETDSYSNRAKQATGQVDQPFAAFNSDQLTPHQLYLACDQLLTQPGTKDLTLVLQSPDTWQWKNWPISWAYWDGTVWKPVEPKPSATVADGAWRVTFVNLPQLRQYVVNGIEAGWLRAQLDLPLPPGASGNGWELPRVSKITVQLNKPPEALPPATAFFNTGALDLSKDFYPFGEQPRFNDTLYIACPHSLARPKAQLKLSVTLTNPAGSASPPAVLTTGNPQIAWEVWDGRVWRAAPADDKTRALTATGDVTITLPDTPAPTLVNGEEAYWLRARLVGGHYGEAAKYKLGTRTIETTGGTTTTKTQYPVDELVPATYAPPVIKALRLEPVGGQQADIPPSACLSYNDFTYVDDTVAATTGQRGAFAPFTTTADREPALYLGFDRPFAARPATLYLQVEPPLPEEVAADQLAELDPTTLAQVTWEYASPSGWRPLGALDETQTLSSRGLVSFVGPKDFVERACFGQKLFWLRARWQRGYFPLPPRLRRVLLNTTWAAQVAAVEHEILGSSNGNPNQTFVTAQTPVQPGQQVVVRERERPAPTEAAVLAALEGADAVTVTQDAAGRPDEIWVRWHAVPDFYASGPRDRHYTADPLTGEICFGDGQAGLIPSQGQNNIRISYHTGGGEQGNRAAQTIVQLKSGIPYIDGATNYEPAQGGAPREPIDRLKARGPQVLRHRDRAIAAQDLEDLAYAASADVARAAAIAPAFDPYNLWLDPAAPAPTDEHRKTDAGRMGVIVVPNSDAARPTPSLGLLRQVLAHLQARCPPTVDLWVAGPEWVRVTVTATVVPDSSEAADAVGGRVRSALERFLHPLIGGPNGQGWAFGRKPHRSDLFAVVEALEGVDHVETLAVAHAPETQDPIRALGLRTMLDQSLAQASQQPPAPDLRRWLDRALVYSGTHEITVALKGTR